MYPREGVKECCREEEMEGGGGKALVAGPLKKPFFAASLGYYKWEYFNEFLKVSNFIFLSYSASQYNKENAVYTYF